MSKNINVNPGQYKVAGRERQGEDINPQVERAKMAKSSEKAHAGHPAPRPGKAKTSAKTRSRTT